MPEYRADTEADLARDTSSVLRFANLETPLADARLCKRPISRAVASALDSAIDAIPSPGGTDRATRSVRLGQSPKGSMVAALVAEQKSAEHSGAFLRFVQSPIAC